MPTCPWSPSPHWVARAATTASAPISSSPVLRVACLRRVCGLHEAGSYAAHNHEHALTQRDLQKTRKYATIASQHNCTQRHFIVSTRGLLGKSAVTLLKQLAHYACSSGTSFITEKEWLKAATQRIAIAIQRGNSVLAYAAMRNYAAVGG